ncbi:MAG: DNA polymerase III subunit gamma/tau [Clostridiales bacterium]|nr:DNA polymerase III subunit gamma/tau [Clostridiales bacterium]
MAYQALYRQWRPANFAQMVGQENIVKTLRNQVASGRIAHAYLFCGSRGTGKTSTAKILSRAFNCESPNNGDPCGTCESCQRLLRGDSLDVQEIDAASNNGVDQVRELRDTVQYPPQYGKYKVYIIDEVHMLSTAAFNALLKTLEEPPDYVVFILATTEPQKVPATILSRCQRFDFGRIPAAQIVGRLREAADGAGAKVSDNALMLIARAAEGGMRDALSILDMCLGYGTEVDEQLVHNVLGTADRSFLFAFAESLKSNDVAAAFGQIDELMRSGREPIVFSRDIAQHLRSLLMGMYCGDELANLLDLTNEDAEAYRQQASGFSPDRLMRILDEYMAVETNMRFAASPRLALETATVRACTRPSDGDVSSMSERINELEMKVQELEKQLADGTLVASKRPAGKGTAKTTPAERNVPSVTRVVDGSQKDIWNAMIDYMKRASPGKYAILAQGKFVGCEGSRYLWEVKAGFDNLVTMMNSDLNRKQVAEAISEAAGQPCGFEAVLEGSQGNAKQNAQEDDFLGSLRETFGAERVTVQEKPKE